jgi:photosystem II stability/assembly factor-like uncharacterized protein
MPDEIDQLRMFRAGAPDPSMAAWTRAEQAIAGVRQQPRVPRRTQRSTRRRVLTALSAISVLAAAIVAAIALHAPATVSTRQNATSGTSLTWSLVGYLVPKGWQLNTHGPAPGPLTCPTATTCYDQADWVGGVRGSGRTRVIRPSVATALYVSTDGARTWRDIPLPSGLTFTSAFACQTAQTCSAGAEDHGKPAFTVTRDGGRTWTTTPLPAAAGMITFLSCPAATTCRALAQGQAGQFDPQLVTTDDGRHFTTTTFPTGDHIYLLSCPTASHCVAAGLSPAFIGPAVDRIPAGLVLVSDDGGATWHPGALPRRVRSWGELECVDARHCFEVGLRINQVNSSTGAVSDYSEMMVSDDGGATWQERPLPARYPSPGIDDLACVSASTCYITGDDDVPQSFENGKAISDSTSIAAVTQDAGLTWQSIGLPEPSSLPQGEPPDVFMSVSSLQCPQANTCIALADNVAGNKYAAIYSTAP